jgi:hypothetical protein
MIHPSLQDQKFWEVLEFLMKLDQKYEINFILDQLKTDHETLNKALLFLADMKVEFQKETIINREFLHPTKQKPKIKIEFDLVDWLKFQAHFPLLQNYKEQPFHQKVAENLAKIEERYKHFDLFRSMRVLGHFGRNLIPTVLDFDQEIFDESMPIRSALEKVIESKQHIQIRLSSHEELINVFPHRLVHLEGALSLVAEETMEKTLMYLPINKIDCVKELEQKYTALHSQMEIDDFISGLRAINGNEVRLVLKILNPENAQELAPLYHFLRKPYVISNPKGDLIWAASVEENEDLYEWLANLQNKVEILDPMSFKINYLAFCERKLKTSA